MDSTNREVQIKFDNDCKGITSFDGTHHPADSRGNVTVDRATANYFESKGMVSKPSKLFATNAPYQKERLNLAPPGYFDEFNKKNLAN